jgi:hypothetical protein
MNGPMIHATPMSIGAWTGFLPWRGGRAKQQYPGRNIDPWEPACWRWRQISHQSYYERFALDRHQGGSHKTSFQSKELRRT